MLEIVELLVVLIVAMVEAAVGFVFLTVELLFVAVTRGFGAARARSVASHSRASALETQGEPTPKDRTTVRSQRHWTWTLGLAGTFVVASVGGLIWRQINAGRIEAAKAFTQTQAESVAHHLAQRGAAPAQGPLPVHDPWGRPLELFLDDFKVATLIVVRSAGPDGQPGTIDDLLGIHTEPKPLRQMAGEVRDAALAGIREKARKLLGRANEDQP